MRLSGLAVIQEEDLMMMIHLLLTCCLDGSDDSDESDLFLCIRGCAKASLLLNHSIVVVGIQARCGCSTFFLKPAGISGKNR